MSANAAQHFDLILLEIKNPGKLTTNFNRIQVFNPFQFFYVPNTTISPWNNRQSRCALLSRLNPVQVMQTYGDTVKPATDLIPSGTLGYKKSDYQALIRTTGGSLPLPQKNQFCFSYIQSSLEKNIRSDFQSMFEKLYPNVSQKSLKDSVHMAKNFKKTGCDGIILALTSNYFDAYEYFLIFSESEANVSGYQDPALAHSIHNSQHIISRTERAKYYRKIVNTLQNNCLIYPLFTMPYEVVFAKKNIDPQYIGRGTLDNYLLSNVIKK